MPDLALTLSPNNLEARARLLAAIKRRFPVVLDGRDEPCPQEEMPRVWQCMIESVARRGLQRVLDLGAERVLDEWCRMEQ